MCVYLFGGNDGNNLIVPLDTTRYTQYQRFVDQWVLRYRLPKRFCWRRVARLYARDFTGQSSIYLPLRLTGN